MTNIWRLTWSHAWGVYWMHCRATDKNNAANWLNVFESDDPAAKYLVSEKKPKLFESDKPHARHIATM